MHLREHAFCELTTNPQICKQVNTAVIIVCNSLGTSIKLLPCSVSGSTTYRTWWLFLASDAVEAPNFCLRA